jgi:integrase
MAKIRTITLQDGKTRRYRFTVDLPHGRGAKRSQVTRTFARRKDAEAELARIGHQARTGEYVRQWDGTVAELLDAYLRSACYEREENTRYSYTNALLLPRERLGPRRAQSVVREDIEALRDYALTSGRRRGGKPGTGLSTRSVILMLQQLGAAFEQGCDDGLITRNPCRKVAAPRLVTAERQTWGEAEVRQFLAVADADRLAAAWRLTLYGLRRGEVIGLRWEDVDLDAATLSVVSTRVLVAYRVIEKAPKSRKGCRTLPLEPAVVAALRALRKRQAAEKLAAGTAYTPGGYVVCDELGAAVHPEWFSDEFRRVRVRAGLRRITLHDSRHTANSLMAAAGVPPHIRAAWCGHTQVVNETAYTHARPEDMAVALGALAKISEVV